MPSLKTIVEVTLNMGKLHMWARCHSSLAVIDIEDTIFLLLQKRICFVETSFTGEVFHWYPNDYSQAYMKYRTFMSLPKPIVPLVLEDAFINTSITEQPAYKSRGNRSGVERNAGRPGARRVLLLVRGCVIGGRGGGL